MGGSGIEDGERGMGKERERERERERESGETEIEWGSKRERHQEREREFNRRWSSHSPHLLASGQKGNHTLTNSVNRWLGKPRQSFAKSLASFSQLERLR